MILATNATVPSASTGMEEPAFSVPMAKFGILQADNVSANQVLNGTTNSVPSSKTVKVEQSGIRTHGLANVLQLLFGTTCTVCPTHVSVDRSGTTPSKLVFVLITESSLMAPVCHLKQFV